MNTYPQVIQGDGVVCVENKRLRGQRRWFSQFRGEKQTGSSQQLQLRLPDRADREEPVDVVHRQGKDLVLALLLLAYLSPIINQQIRIVSSRFARGQTQRQGPLFRCDETRKRLLSTICPVALFQRKVMAKVLGGIQGAIDTWMMEVRWNASTVTYFRLIQLRVAKTG